MGGGVGLILKAEAYSSVFLLLIVLTVEILSFSNAAAALSHVKTPSNSSSKYSIKRRHFPPDFLFGVTTSSYQYEGGTWEDGRRPSIWDAFTHSHPNNIKDKSNGDIAADSYHLYKDDIALVKQLGMNAYRFSVSWSRVLPNRKVNEKGIKYYNNVINEAISQGLTPFLTLFHLDLPQALQDEYGGFLSNRIVNDFRDFADLCFREFGDRVKHWITLNEPGTFLSGGYVVGDLAPGRCTPPRCEEGKSDVEPYKVCHNMLLAHATAVELYRRKYQKSQSGVIGVAVNADWLIPYNASNALDHKAAQRAYDFNLGWFLDPMVRGDYPSSMKYYVGDRLPKFSKEESKLLSGTFDFLGINYYSSRYVMDLSYIGSHYGDAHVNTTYERDGKLIGPLTAAPWIHVYPRGLCNVLLYIKHKYQNPLIYVTENGVAEAANGTKPPAGVGRDSNVAVSYFQTHLSSLRRAIKKGANVKGYFVWSLLDNFEWNSGYTLRFGLYQVEVQNPSIRIPRKTAIWFQKFLKAD